jgi:Tol biopolymer transport system component
MKATRVLAVLSLVTAIFLSSAGPTARAGLPAKNGPIVFAREVLKTPGSDPSFDIFRARRNGSHAVQLTSNILSDEDPAWSPNGNRILFERENDTLPTGGYDVYVMNAKGEEEFVIQGYEGGADPAWSPDGKSIVFVNNDGDVATLSLVNPNAEPVTVAVNPYDDPLYWWASDPKWSPDGRRIAFTAEEDQSAYLEIVNKNGRNRRRLEVALIIRGLDWSPSGNRLALGMFGPLTRGWADSSLDSEIYTINPDAPHPKKSIRRITKSSREEIGKYDPVWSPDGNKLIFSRSRGADDELELVKVNAAFWKRPQPKVLTHNSVDDIDPDWRARNSSRGNS